MKIKTHLRNARLQLRECLTPYLKDEDIPWHLSSSAQRTHIISFP